MSNTVNGTVKWFNEAKGFGFIRQVLFLVLLSSLAACSSEAKTYEYTVIVSGGPSGWPIWVEEVTLNGDRRIPGGAISYGYDQTPPTGSRVVLDAAPVPQRVEARWFSHRTQRFFEVSLPMPEEFSETVARWFESYPTPDYGHYFIVGFSGKGEIEAKPFYGLSAQLWSETVRTDEQYEYMVFPRVLAAAERAWHRADWENDYKVGVEYSQETNLVNKQALNSDFNRFANIVGQRELAKLEKAGIDYRLPVPGAQVVDGKLAMNVQFPGVELQYSADGENWLTYDEQQRPSVSGETYIRSISEIGEKVSRVTSVK